MFFKNENYSSCFFLHQVSDKKFLGALLYCIILSNFSVEVVQSIETFGHCSPVFGTQTRTTHHDENGAIFSYKKEKKKPTENSLYKSHQGFPFQAFSFQVTLTALRRHKSSNCVGATHIKNRVHTIRSTSKSCIKHFSLK